MGGLIGPKTWDRIDTGFLEPRCSRSCFRDCLGVVCVDLFIEWLLGMHWTGNGRGLRVH